MFRFALTIFVSAFLLFQVQPLIGRFILPWFGGGPSIWTSCMLFFQILLLGGYLYAHLISVKLKPRTQVVTHLSLLAASLVFLPIAPSDAWKPTADQSPLLQILLLLLATVGGPYFMLSSTGPLMQKWFSQTSPGSSPYRLYALSNVGSLLALLSYPFVFEPWLTLRQQVWSWSLVYGAYVGLAAWCGLSVWRLNSAVSEMVVASESVTRRAEQGVDLRVARPGIGTMLLWLGLAACSSAMLLATTNQLCIDVATVPFLWVLPLSLYLISFIICFDSPQWYDRRAFGLLLLVCGPMGCWIVSEGADVKISKQVVIYSTILFACCMTCHGELVSSKPNPKYLTLFYVLVSAGGALGGAFVAIVAPAVFHGYWEYHIGLVACCVMTLIAWATQRIWLRSPSPEFWIWAIVSIAQTGSVAYLAYAQISRLLSERAELVVFGVYALILMAGFLIVGALERRKNAIFVAYAGLSAIQVIWLIVSSLWEVPGVVDSEIAFKLGTLAVVSPIVAAGLVVWARKAGEITRRFYVLAGLYAAVAAISSLLFYFEWLEEWQLISLSCTAFAGLLMDWSSRGFRGLERPSLGFWLLVPSITLTVLLANRLAEIVKTSSQSSSTITTIHTSRNFYGVLRVKHEASTQDADNFIRPRNALTHGQIRHGFQYVDDYWKRQPTTYYGRESGVGLAIKQSRRHAKETDQHALRVGVVGLGTGTIAAYGEEGESFRFYDINPDVVELSESIFTYLRDSPAKTEVVIGDARIVMERELAAGQSQQFDVLAIDAFSRDAIPVHLLTSECGEIYRQQLRPGGILAIHISNRFLDLNPVSRGMAEHLGWQAVRIENDGDELNGVFSSTWILLTSDPDFARDPDIEGYIEAWEEDEGILHWTDDYSGLWQVLSF